MNLNRMKPPVKACAVLLLVVCIWRIFGAPVSKTDLQKIGMQAWQARILLPQRVERMLVYWMGYPVAEEDEETFSSHSYEQDAKISVYLTQENRLVQMSFEGYVCGVVAAEMPAQYHMEALKAQAVAARTRLLRQMKDGGCSLHPDADICTDSSHCQGYATLAQCREKWGESYEIYCDRIVRAQRETQREWIAYEGEPITVLYHAISGGRTENVQSVFSQELPYLVSVHSEGEERVRGYQEETLYTFNEIAKVLNQSLDMELTAEELRRTFAISGYTESGRVQSVQIGNRQIDGTLLRNALGLRSTWFSISMDHQGILFHQRGYGHGVGMSQAGANSMAAAGADYKQIIQHYYTGVYIVQ